MKTSRLKTSSMAVLPWRQFMVLGGVLVAMMAGATLMLAPKGGWLIATRAVLALSLFSALSGVILLLLHHRQASKGLDVALSDRRGYALAGLIASLLLAFVSSFAPIPFPATWMNNVLPLLGVVLALWLGSRLLQGAAPLDYQRAQRAYAEGDFDTALALLRGLEGSHPDFYGTYHLQATIYRQRKDYEAARRAANRLIALQPELYHGYADLGLTLLEEARPAEAREPLRRAVELAPELPEGQFNLGMAYVEAEDYEKAIAPLRRALRLGLRDEITGVMARYHLFRALEALGRHAEAEVELRRLRRCSGVLKRWRRELSEDLRPAKERRQEQALLSAIERAAKKPRLKEDRS